MKSSFHRTLLAAASVLALAALSGPALAQTTVNTNWNGAGTLHSDGNATNSSSYNFNTGGTGIAGSLSYNNAENNPYGYGVANTNLDVQASVLGGGIDSTTNRTGSYAPLYGAAGQSIYAQVVSSDGAAELVQHTGVNYAGLQDLGYGTTKTSGGDTLQANGSVIALNYSVNTGTPYNNAGISVNGSGSASLNQNYAGANASSLALGTGGGLYQLANFSAQGIGSMQTGGLATGSLGVVSSNATIYGTPANPASVLTTVNYDTTGHPPGTVQTWNYGITGNAN